MDTWLISLVVLISICVVMVIWRGMANDVSRIWRQESDDYDSDEEGDEEEVVTEVSIVKNEPVVTTVVTTTDTIVVPVIEKVTTPKVVEGVI